MMNSVALVQHLVQGEGYSHGFAVNLGAGDGVEGMPGVQSNDARLRDPVYPLFHDMQFDGLAVEGNANYLDALKKNLPRPGVTKTIAFATPLTVKKLLQDAKTPTEFTYFKNDLDGYDCTVDWAVLKSGYRPKLLQLEVNPEIPWPVAFGVQYSEHFEPKLGLAGFYGCSLKLTTEIVGAYGYELVGVGDTHDAFFARSDERKKMGLPVLDGGAASAQLLSCCNPHHFGLGVAEAWAEAAASLDPATLVEMMQPTLQQSCGYSQGTANGKCAVSYTLALDGMGYIAEIPALP